MHGDMVEVTPCPQCSGSPITVRGGVAKLCAACFLGPSGQEPPPVRLVAALVHQVGELQRRQAALESEAVTLRHRLATLRFADTDRRRLQALLGACIGVSTEALEQGALWDLVDAAADLVSHYRIGLARMGAKHHGYNPGCKLCRLCRLETAVEAVAGREIFSSSYKRRES